MRRIIDNKLYDTDKATLVAEHYEGYNNEFYSICEALYIKKTGEWFLNGEGGQCTRYRDADEGGVIEPFAEDEAKDWLADKNFIDEYIQYFEEPEE